MSDYASKETPKVLNQDLRGCCILITRPEPAASKLSDYFKQSGAHCETLSALDIVPLPLSTQTKDAILNLDRFDQIIFISQHAAKFGMERIDQYWPQLPVNLHWHGIGDKTRNVLQQFDVAPVLTDNPVSTLNDSEMLLTQSLLQSLDQQKILIVKGHGGRTVLTDSLIERGAQVTEAELYERALPSYSNEIITQRLIQFKPTFIVALSGETVENLFLLAKKLQGATGDSSDAAGVLKRATWILPSQRVAEIAIEKGIKQYLIPVSLTPEGIMQIIKSKL